MPSITKHKPGEFCWFELSTTNQTEAKRFYQTLFGWTSEDMPIGPDEAAASLEVCAGIYAAALLGRPVSLPLDRTNRFCRGIAASDYEWHQGGRPPAVSASATADSLFESMRGVRP